MLLPDSLFADTIYKIMQLYLVVVRYGALRIESISGNVLFISHDDKNIDISSLGVSLVLRYWYVLVITTISSINTPEAHVFLLTIHVFTEKLGK